MKYTRVLFTAWLFLLLLFSLAGCEFLTAMFSPVVGNWTLYADWESDGTYRSGPIEFKSNQRFVQESYEGSWSQDGDSITFTYDGGTSYTGTLDSTHGRMEGTMTSWSGSTGQWYAEKLTVR